MSLLTWLRVYVVASMTMGLGGVLYLYVLSLINNSPDVPVHMDMLGEWWIELVLYLPLIVLVPLWAYLDRKRLISFIADEVSA